MSRSRGDPVLDLGGRKRVKGDGRSEFRDSDKTNDDAKREGLMRSD